MTQTENLKGKIAVVTGASRGIGKGVATVLGAQGATVYVTGRTQAAGEHPLPGTIYETAASITASGGVGVAVACDHADDAQVRALCERVETEQGHLVLLSQKVALWLATGSGRLLASPSAETFGDGRLGSSQ